MSYLNEELPTGWTWVTLAELAAREANSITDGPFGSNLKTAHYVDAGPRVIRLQNIGDGHFVDARAHISADHFVKLKKHRVFEGDVVIAALGEHLPRACVIPGSIGLAIVKADCIRFKPDPRLADARFLNWMLNAEPTRRRTAAVVHGVGRPRMNLGEIRVLQLPMAPFPEQKRIVAAIEEQFTRLDAAVTSLLRARANLIRYRAAVFRAAGEGLLILNDDHSDSVAANGLPSQWRWLTVEQLGASSEQTVLTGPFGTSLGRADFVSDGVPVFTIGCLTDRGLRLDKALYVSPTKAAELERYRVRSGDFLFSRMASVGRAGIVPVALEGALINYHIMRLRLDSSLILPEYFFAFVRGARSVAEYLRDVNHGATRDGINTAQLLGLPVAVPPLELQKAIVTKIDQRLTVLDDSERSVESNLRRAVRLRQAILIRAFEGRLVPQDHSDEPANVLLERMRTERTTADVNATASLPRRRITTITPQTRAVQEPLPF